MAKTSRDAHKHIRELSEFFRDGKEIALEIVEEFINQYKRKKYLRQSLERLTARGFLKTKDGKISPTKEGLRFFRRHMKNKMTAIPKEGKWYLISFDIPVKLNSKRVALRRLLRDFNFYPFQKSVWIGPEPLSAEVWEFIVENKLEKFCRPMFVEILE
ncbi:MAG: hypothetical protein UY26_C0003G0214 [Candidatus Jorgensenbacteria bacterium GW2011_GWA1_48_13]|uniref:Transcriptional repressor PaaX-like central Cas2-like domain-containing protein n=1 Tax=Candidatus Jorgensenbacteria bacterium GW2011_GWB1_50_10 TaxID=1618665 RepID=A0A0G1Z883_9BACT|nr:MAG: hypothetical protein UX26_C0020G0003 [Parcubacteria group bacterium GW2011_GWC1_45_9]KKU94064.1 MAG: hypothetical protein UY26_C0003G0214 [Candidatus Jorgensenbacteria bacterium GW2011_GWA1_48_13]KKW15169.1 MAG: hypothetical protein UY55_C0002G0227 [Candidatus Jorgensenbacteria bacterium GW2011_GWB1_50_10]